MYQIQLCIVVLLGEGRCIKNTSMVVFWGREDVSKPPVWWCFGGRKMHFLKALYGGVIREGKMF